MTASCGYREADAYRRFAEAVAPVLAQTSVDSVRREAADALARLLPYDAFDLRTADQQRRELVPVLARGPRAAVVMRRGRIKYGVGLSGWVASHEEPLLANDGPRDPRAMIISGTPPLPEAVLGVPLAARGQLKDVLLVRRFGDVARFSEAELALTRCLADLVAIALDNADARERLHQEAITDPLTGLANRRHFMEELAKAVSVAEHLGQDLSVLLIDVDGLKLTNDTLGHHVGDRLLTAVADTVRAELDDHCVAARLAGDEFAVVLQQTHPAQARAIARGLEHAINKEVRETVGLPDCGASVGHAGLGIKSNDVEGLLRAADRSMCKTKRRHHRNAARRD